MSRKELATATRCDEPEVCDPYARRGAPPIIDMEQLDPGVYATRAQIKAADRAHQWALFWSSIRLLVIGTPIIVILDQLFT